MNLAERRTRTLAERKTEQLARRKAVKLAERRWPRMKLDTPVVLHLWTDGQESDMITRSYELSEGGMAISAPTQFEVGDRMMLSLAAMKAAYRQRIAAVVRNQRGSRCGLEFVDLDDDQREELAHYLGAMSGVAES